MMIQQFEKKWMYMYVYKRESRYFAIEYTRSVVKFLF